MPDYVGDSLRIFTQAEDFDGKLLTDADVAGAVTIVNADASVVIVNSAPMAYSTVDEGFFYVWQTVGQTPGTYQWESFIGGGLHQKYEFGKIRLKARPF